MHEIYRFRYRIFCEEIHMLDPKNYPDGEEKDEYDPFAEHFMILDDKNDIVGTFRLVLNNPLGFPGLNHMHLESLLETYDADRLAEFSRIAIAKNHRGLRNMISLVKLLLKRGCIYLKRKKIDFVFFAVEDAFYRIIMMTRLPFKKVAGGIEYFGKERNLLIMDYNELREKHPIFCR